MLTATQLGDLLAQYGQADISATLNRYGRERVVETLLAEIASNGGAGGGGGGGGVTQADILAAINAAAFNTSNNSRYEFQLGTDDNGNYVVRYDKQTGIVATLTTAGATYTPVNPQAAIPEDREIRVAQYEALTTSAGNWAPEDILERVQVLDVSGTTPVVVSTQWFEQDGSIAGATPVIGTDVRIHDKVQQEIVNHLQAIVTNTTPLANPLPFVSNHKGFADTAAVVFNTPVAPGGGGLFRIKSLYNANGATQHYLQFHIDNGAPVAGDVPVEVLRCRPNSTDILDETFTKGMGDALMVDQTLATTVPAGSSVYVVRSSTPNTYTPVTLTAPNATQTRITISRSW